MKHALAALCAVLVVSCATPSREQSLVDRAVNAMGGAERIAAIKTVAVKANLKQWEPEQSDVPGGEPRFANEASVEVVQDRSRRASRTDWVKNFAYPAPRTFTYSEIVTPQAGYVLGVDSNGRNAQSMKMSPPAHSMSGHRLATTQREARRASQTALLTQMQASPDKVQPASDIGGHPAVSFDGFIVAFDPATGLPSRVRTLDYDNLWGDVTYDMLLSDWREFDGVKIAMKRRTELNGRLVADTTFTDVRINPVIEAARFEVPAALSADAARPAIRNIPYQWVIRRQFIGVYLDSEVPSFDTRASTGLRLVQLAPGVQHVVGGSHNSLIVEMKDHLVVFDAPVSDWQSVWLLGAAQVKYTGKPVKYLVLTHHHMDHAGGIRAYAADGATLVVGKGTAEHYRRVLAAPFTRNPDLPAKDLSKTPIVEVADKHVLTDGEREVHAYIVANNPHADGLLIGYVPQAKLGFVTDIWIPGAGPLPDKLTPPLAAFVGTVKKAGITVEKFAGGHGSTADYAPLAALEGK